MRFTTNSSWQRVRYFFQIIAVTCIFCQSHACNDTEIYRTTSGINCRYCEAGFYLVADCKFHMDNAVCDRCPIGHYQSVCNNDRQCISCRLQCQEMQEMVSTCSSTTNMECQCKEGRYWLQHTSTDGVCLPHKKCPIGTGLFRNGTRTEDNQCKHCSVGTFSNQRGFEPCRQCTKCDAYKSKCSREKDAICFLPDDTSDDSGLSIGMIAAICTCVALPTSVVAIVLACWYKRHQHKPEQPTEDADGNNENKSHDILKDAITPNDGPVNEIALNEIVINPNLPGEPSIEKEENAAAVPISRPDSGYIDENSTTPRDSYTDDQTLISEDNAKPDLKTFHSQETGHYLKRKENDDTTDSASESEDDDLNFTKNNATDSPNSKLKRINCKGPMLAQETKSLKSINPLPLDTSGIFADVRGELSGTHLDENSVPRVGEMNRLKDDQKMSVTQPYLSGSSSLKTYV